MEKISVVVPFYNEEGSVEALLDEIRQMCSHLPIAEVIAIDDASRDQTASILQAIQPRFPALKLIQHSRNLGQSAALWTGLHAAQSPWVLTVDGDGQNNPKDWAHLILAQQQSDYSWDLVCGQRVKRNDGFMKRISSKIANKVRGWILRDQTPDTGCGIKLMRVEIFRNFPYFDHMHRYLPALYLHFGGRVVSVPVSHRSREKGQSKYGTWDRLKAGIYDLVGVGWYLRRSKKIQYLMDSHSKKA